MVIWYIFPPFGTLYQEKSGNPNHYGTRVSYSYPMKIPQLANKYKIFDKED
jgi:hypothetical protein